MSIYKSLIRLLLISCLLVVIASKDRKKRKKSVKNPNKGMGCENDLIIFTTYFDPKCNNKLQTGKDEA